MAPPSEPEPGPVIVRYDRTTGAWILVIGSVMLLVLLAADLLIDPRRALMYLLSYVCAAILIYVGANALVRNVYFTYDPDTGRLETRSIWGTPRTYPRPGYDWIAYSSATLRIREVAPDGRSRVVPVTRGTADSADWADFLGRLLDLSAPDEADQAEERP